MGVEAKRAKVQYEVVTPRTDTMVLEGEDEIEKFLKLSVKGKEEYILEKHKKRIQDIKIVVKSVDLRIKVD